ncbi:lipid IV(A) 3-deoxy-D-manno-octulosonic acid transferase [Legionella sp. km772]|uniref:lipid IV(A) 3-deoxy-D-manno-octulosonic acid transferase n=1 Tax=Legionella sp. km772 TaxID=2498111 RepID=UPI000F8C78B0|nr:lipid IV(A) 3-deoxy-D-manno-octulosonic acid transferase [Legionella sp. km772]RUR11371.1 3-deoxy-D-manno-octulosonic acid transferase [Legionella sp. km772]
MRWIYSLLMYLLSPYLLVRLWWKGRKLPAYRERILERFCWDKLETRQVDVWLHAVSLGEVIAATPLIDAMLKKQWSILITTMTPTGAAQVKTRFGDKVVHRYVPYDLYGAVKCFFSKIKPKVGIIMETELWPNLIAEAKAAQIPLFLANARLSERSLQGYMRFKFLFKPILNQFTAILAQSNDDAARFITLGAESKRVFPLGNMKFDLHTNTIDLAKFQEIKARWGTDRTALIIASTHDDEESRILAELRRLQAAIPGVILLIAPRHPERFQAVYQLCMQQGFNTGLRSNLESLNTNNEVVVLDCLGELLGLYQISDYAFVGGSLVPVGGHNVLEPIAMQVPVLSGNQVHNFKTICRDLEDAQAIVLVKEADELIDAIIQLSSNQEAKQAMVARATHVLESNKGSVSKHLDKIAELG